MICSPVSNSAGTPNAINEIPPNDDDNFVPAGTANLSRESHGSSQHSGRSTGRGRGLRRTPPPNPNGINNPSPLNPHVIINAPPSRTPTDLQHALEEIANMEHALNAVFERLDRVEGTLEVGGQNSPHTQNQPNDLYEIESDESVRVYARHRNNAAPVNTATQTIHKQNP